MDSKKHSAGTYSAIIGDIGGYVEIGQRNFDNDETTILRAYDLDGIRIPLGAAVSIQVLEKLTNSQSSLHCYTSSKWRKAYVATLEPMKP